MTVIDWDKSDMLNYLGTYFPRSYAEAYCIFNYCFGTYYNKISDQEEISILDFGSGTGGEIIGLVTVLSERFPQLNKLKITPLDGNGFALHLFDCILSETRKHISIDLEGISSPIHIEDFYDLSILDRVIYGEYDIIISFKAICEFVTKQQFERQNAYEHIVKFLMTKLSKCGLLLLVDVTTYNNTSNEWLPMMLDQGIVNANAKIVERNLGYNQTFQVTHSHKANDVSKVAWRLMLNK